MRKKSKWCKLRDWSKSTSSLTLLEPRRANRHQLTRWWPHVAAGYAYSHSQTIERRSNYSWRWRNCDSSRRQFKLGFLKLMWTTLSKKAVLLTLAWSTLKKLCSKEQRRSYKTSKKRTLQLRKAHRPQSSRRKRQRRSSLNEYHGKTVFRTSYIQFLSQIA